MQDVDHRQPFCPRLQEEGCNLFRGIRRRRWTARLDAVGHAFLHVDDQDRSHGAPM
jgi:hypothetical protein